MKNLLIILILITLPMSIQASTYKGQEKVKKVDEGQRIFRNKLQKKCGFTASYWAQQHTQSEWEALQDNGTFKEELTTMCKRNISTIVKDKWMEPLYLFAVEYAKDAGKRPRC